ncbi:hypothetical protein [Spirilliplanes yamanashiensis]|uniref:Uncharacterized protein n=1 Tax=Spirilliplanes yamanashiensis TaxID=42233 RepID=A0A8J4DMZ0_9ACTN|nr:hypothetical protein [Spirilliplanes yamanashiensis]MDP9818272.1 vacuolar-type H+-ATPase subunit F/Vma7 [Spirilliplanes yamanashiensis]GIJ06690.1 hypothetical protein Sya03_60420 [Spirilliplanes yamanashiensis]
MAIIGDPVLIRGWALAGVLPLPAADAAAARAAWAALPADVGLVVLTPHAAAALERGPDRPAVLRAVLP